jgi:hypothetical protein
MSFNYWFIVRSRIGTYYFNRHAMIYKISATYRIETLVFR